MQDLRQPFFKIIGQIIGLMLFVGAVLIISVKAYRPSASAFSLAEDCPRGALVYAQFADLPALVKQWDDSPLKQQYLASTNFQQLTGQHLAIKLAQRWEEFNNALGFPLDLSVLGASADNGAALAVYDIGRLEMLLIAPLSAEKMAVNQLLKTKDHFQAQELPDGDVYYLHAVEADRGRQKQEIAFAAVRGRFVLATSERLLLRAIANLNGQAQKDRLTDEPSFQALSREMIPHVITVWLDQTKLNSDWYFRHYWIMHNADGLGQLRAGMLDFEMQDGQWIEHRDFLLAGGENRKRASLPPTEQQRLISLIPHDAPYFHLRALGDDPGAATTLMREVFLAHSLETKKAARGWNWRYYDDGDFEGNGEQESQDSRYSYLDQHYDQTINDALDAGVKSNDERDDSQLRIEAGRQAEMGLRQAVQPARPLFAANVAGLRAATGPLFAESRRATILTLAAPAKFNSSAFEQALSNLASNNLMVAGSAPPRSVWESRTENGAHWREMSLPLVGWRLCYALRGQELILANGADWLSEMLASKTGLVGLEKSAEPVSELTVIRLNQRPQAFDQVVEKLDAQRIKAYRESRRGNSGSEALPSQEFFSGNLASLLGVASRVREVHIRRSWQTSRLREDVVFSF